MRGRGREPLRSDSLEDRRQTWVQPYLKGPDEAEAWAKVYRAS